MKRLTFTFQALSISKTFATGLMKIFQRIHEMKTTPHYQSDSLGTISSFEFIGPYFFEDNNMHIVLVNSQHYVKMLENFLQLELAHCSLDQNTCFLTRRYYEPPFKFSAVPCDNCSTFVWWILMIFFIICIFMVWKL